MQVVLAFIAIATMILPILDFNSTRAKIPLAYSPMKLKVNHEIRGIVRPGKGKAREFTQLDWVRAQAREKLGFDPFPGTLNLEMTDRLRFEQGAVPNVLIEPKPGFCAARCYRVSVNNSVNAVWIVPEVNGYPPDQVELIAPVSLREKLHLRDGSIVTLRLTGTS